METKKKWALMLSDEPGKQCDIYPNRSIHELDVESGIKNKVANKGDYIPHDYPFLLLDEKPATKQCASCRNEFELSEEFINDEGKESCVRCITRLYVPARIREQMVAVIQKTDRAIITDLRGTVKRQNETIDTWKVLIEDLQQQIRTYKNRAERRLNKILSLVEVKKVKTARIISLRQELRELKEKNG
ncbi:MAG: hypothetical protein V4547_18180 [Bacteroidota bacterium]